MSKTIYRDFDHWWQQGNHGFTSASRDYAREIWDDLAPTIEASRDDYKNAYVSVTTDFVKRRSDFIEALLAYVEEFVPKSAPRFGRWWLDQINQKKGN